jgi:hypothetical protein
MSNIVTGMAQAIGNEAGFSGVPGLNWEIGSGGNVFEGFLPARPNKIVAVLPSGGYEADSGLPYDSPSLQIIVRSDEDPVWALDMWYAVYNRVQGMANVVLPDGTYLVSCIAIQSGPVHIGKDEAGRFQYGMNLQTEIKNPTEERPDHE